MGDDVPSCSRPRRHHGPALLRSCVGTGMHYLYGCGGRVESVKLILAARKWRVGARRSQLTTRPSRDGFNTVTLTATVFVDRVWVSKQCSFVKMLDVEVKSFQAVIRTASGGKHDGKRAGKLLSDGLANPYLARAVTKRSMNSEWIKSGLETR